MIDPPPPIRARSKARRPLLTAALVLGAVTLARAATRRARRMQFRGRVALVTGGSRGLGLGPRGSWPARARGSRSAPATSASWRGRARSWNRRGRTSWPCPVMSRIGTR